MNNLKRNSKKNNSKSYLLLFLFIFSCVLQVSVTLKYAALVSIKCETKTSKRLVYKLPDTPENPEKNNCDYFEEDNDDESSKDIALGDNFFVNEIRDINNAHLVLIKHCKNYMESHAVENIYLSLRSLKI